MGNTVYVSICVRPENLTFDVFVFIVQTHGHSFLRHISENVAVAKSYLQLIL